MATRKAPSENGLDATDVVGHKAPYKRPHPPPGTAGRKDNIRTSMISGAAASNPDKPLTEKQKLFAKYWAEGDSLRVAGRKAGYSLVSYSMLTTMSHQPSILKAYNTEKVAFAEASQMTRRRVMDGLLEAIDMAKLMSEPASMISGWREVAKMCGYFEPHTKKVEITLTGQAVMGRLDKLSDAELLKLVQDTVLLADDVTDGAAGDGDGE